MSINYDQIIKNFKEYIYNNFQYKITNSSFSIKQKTYSKNYKMDESDKKMINNSIDWLQKMKIYHCEYAFTNEKIILFKYDSPHTEKQGNYIIILSNENIRDLSYIKDMAIEQELDLGIFLHLFNKKDNNPFINRNKEMEELDDLLGIEYNDDVNNHKFSDLLELFGGINVLKVRNEYLDENSNIEDYEEFIFRFLGKLKCGTKLNNINREYYFTKETITNYNEVFNSKVKNFPYENLYLSLNHNSPKYIFLEIYRIIEKLYPIIYCYNVKKQLNIKDKELIELKNIFNEELSWKHKERDSINKIFNTIKKSDNINNHYNNIYEYLKSIISDTLRDELGNHIYDIRNSSVHLSFEDKEKIDINKILEKDTIVCNLIPIVHELYIMLFK